MTQNFNELTLNVESFAEFTINSDFTFRVLIHIVLIHNISNPFKNSYKSQRQSNTSCCVPISTSALICSSKRKICIISLYTFLTNSMYIIPPPLLEYPLN